MDDERGLDDHDSLKGAWIADQKKPLEQRQNLPDPDQFDYATMQQHRWPRELVEKLQTAQTKELTKEGKVADAAALSDDISTRIGDLNPRLPVEEFNKERQGIIGDLAELHKSDSYLASRLSSELNRKVIESRVLPEEHKIFLFQPKTGFNAKVDAAIQKANRPGLMGFGSQPLTPHEAMALSDSIKGAAFDLAKKHPEWTATQLDDALNADPHTSDVLQRPMLAEAQQYYTNKGKGKEPTTSGKFNPAEFQ
jgi:hypothetical protein